MVSFHDTINGRDTADRNCQAAYALQSYFFSQIITVFQLTGQRLVDGGNFWSLMFFILAVCIGACYFTIGYAAHSVSVVSMFQH